MTRPPLVLAVLAVPSPFPVFGFQHDHSAPPASPPPAGTVIDVPPTDAGADTLEARGKAETASLYFGLDEAKAVDRIEVRWPSGPTQTVAGPVAVNSTVDVTEK